MMKCRRGGGKERKVKWRWKRGEIEEVKVFMYLGYKLHGNGRQEAHIRERLRKGMMVMKQMWGMGKRRFGGDWGKRLWLFDKLDDDGLWSRDLGIEREREEIERLQERYLRWVLGIEWSMPEYMVRKELQREKL